MCLVEGRRDRLQGVCHKRQQWWQPRPVVSLLLTEGRFQGYDQRDWLGSLLGRQNTGGLDGLLGYTQLRKKACSTTEQSVQGLEVVVVTVLVFGALHPQWAVRELWSSLRELGVGLLFTLYVIIFTLYVIIHRLSILYTKLSAAGKIQEEREKVAGK